MLLTKFRILTALMKRLLIAMLSVAIFLGVERLCHLATDGFALVKITNPLPIESEFIPPFLQPEEREDLLHILSQPFYYLSCGGQSFVFTSSDGHYVLKFLKFHHRRIPPWLQKIPLPRNLKDYRASKVARKTFRLKRNLRSYVVAYNHLKEETGIVYHHLQKTDELHQHLCFFDKIGYRYEINLDDYAFVIQKKGLSTSDMLDTLMKEGRLPEAKEKLSQLIEFSVRRCQKGVGDRDFKFRSNLGFIDGRASQIDLGSLSLDEKQQNPEFYKAEITRSAQRFCTWLKEKHPVLVEDFNQAIARLNEHDTSTSPAL